MDVLKSKFVGDSNYNYDNDSDNENKIDKLYGPKGFFFQQRRGNLNLRALTTVNIDRLIRDVDIDLLQQHMENITFCNLQENDLRYLTDPQIVKLFKISQLTIEYLLYSQDQLVANLDELSKKYSSKKRCFYECNCNCAAITVSTIISLLHLQ